MMRRCVVISALLLAVPAVTPAVGGAQFGTAQLPVADASQRFSAQQIDNLAGPVALYPDALLAQVLVAATFPEQIEDAADFVRAYGTDSIDVQGWDVSVKAVAHYPSALNAMADKIDWTTALGKAYAVQSSDVMASVQRLRQMAANQGNLQSTAEQQIVTTNNTYQIVPVQTRVIYVPVYDPYVIYARPIFNLGYRSRYWSFGVGFPIGGWLNYDLDWGVRRVYYNGWNPTYYAVSGGWRGRSRPFVQITNVYISPRYTNVYVNRNVSTRSVNYYNVDRYASVHNGRHFDNRHDGRYDNRDTGNDESRYAVRRDANNGTGAVSGGGYRSPNAGNTAGANNSTNSAPSTRNVPRGANNGGANNGGANNGGANNGRTRGNDVRDGSGYGNNRVNTAPAQRRSEPSTRIGYGPQIITPQRQGASKPETQAQPQSQQRRAQPRSQGPAFTPQGAMGRMASPPQQRPVFVPQSRQPAPQQRATPARAEPRVPSPPPTVRPQQRSAPASLSGSARTARRRGSNN